jgi:predicted DNA binding CopG/RHH family protein
MKKIKLDPEEQDILDSFERGEWKPVPNQKREIARHMQYAKKTLAKDQRVNIRISSRDLEQLQTIAVEDGLPYQTLMASVLHRFVSGRFVETSSRTSSRTGRRRALASSCP